VIAVVSLSRTPPTVFESSFYGKEIQS
jgi:hypothetical protein